jgi:hypothetical protein
LKTLTIRISRSTHDLLRELARRSDRSMVQLVDEAVRDYQRKRFWDDYQASYTALKADSRAWAEYQEEVGAWEATIADGLEEPAHEPRTKRKPAVPR